MRTRPAKPGTSRPKQVAAAAPPARWTNRMAILLVVFVVLLVSYASSLRAYFDQRAQIGELRAEITSSQRHIDALKAEKARWKDPAYVETQARIRFGWVLPGETAYQVLDRNGQALTRSDRLTNPESVAPRTPEAWWGRAYASIDAADHPEKYAKPDPTTRLTPDENSSEGN